MKAYDGSARSRVQLFDSRIGHFELGFVAADREAQEFAAQPA